MNRLNSQVDEMRVSELDLFSWVWFNCYKLIQLSVSVF